MSLNIEPQQEWASASQPLHDAFTDFILSRKAMLCSQKTLNWYLFTLGMVIEWLVMNGVTAPEQIEARHVRAYLSKMAGKGLSDSYIHNHARAIRTLLHFFLNEKYIPAPVVFQMPSLANKRLPCLSEEDVKKLIDACQEPRDKALVMLMVDTGLRREEVCQLNWADVDISSGLVRVVRGREARPGV
jgi:site-specific recombinase XerD